MLKICLSKKTKIQISTLLDVNYNAATFLDLTLKTIFLTKCFKTGHKAAAQS